MHKQLIEEIKQNANDIAVIVSELAEKDNIEESSKEAEVTVEFLSEINDALNGMKTDLLAVYKHPKPFDIAANKKYSLKKQSETTETDYRSTDILNQTIDEAGSLATEIYLKLYKFLDLLKEVSKNPEHGEDIIDSFIVDVERVIKNLHANDSIFELYKFYADKGQSDLETLAGLATEFDKSGDPILMKQAEVLDEILLTIGAQKSKINELKSNQDNEINRLKAVIAEATKENKDLYSFVKAYHEKNNDAEGAKKALEKIKNYRPMEASLSTRTCPDHPGTSVIHIGEDTYQCSLDKAIYNYQAGFTTMNGNKIPGGSVSNQTQQMLDMPNEFTAFNTREQRMNQ